MKTCTKCNQIKPLTEYYKRGKGYNSRCKHCCRAKLKKYYENNPEKFRTYVKKYRENNLEKCRARSKKYYENNREKRSAYKKKYRENNREKRRAYTNRRYETDIKFRTKTLLRSRIKDALKKKKKSSRSMELIGCSILHFMKHIEKQFVPGMTWENQGEWHIDHMIPCASFDLEDPEQQRRCFHYTNQQPLWAAENISKGDKIIYNRVWNGNRWVSK